MRLIKEMTDWPVPRIQLKHSRFWRLASIITSTSVGILSQIFAYYLNKTQVHNLDQLLKLTCERPKGKPLITVSNHDSCCDDPLVFGAMLPLSTFRNPCDPSYRWALGAKEVCFSRRSHSLFFRLGQVLPIIRGNGVYQPIMQEALEELNRGSWLHMFPEGKVNETKEFIRLKWGVGRLIADCNTTPIVLPFYHLGMDSVLPNKKPYMPQINQKTTIVIGNPMNFDEIVKELKDKKKSAIEIRKHITDIIQEEFYKLKAKAEKLHEQHLKGA